MSGEIYIPPATLEKMNTSHPKGNRHHAALSIAISLIGQGMHPDAVYAQLRGQFDAEKSDKELRDIVTFAVSKNPEPAGYGDQEVPRQKRAWTPPQRTIAEKKKLPPREAVKICVGDKYMSAVSWGARCKSPLPTDPEDQTRELLSTLYGPSDRINIVGRHFIAQDGKAKPRGGGKTLTRDEWLEYITNNGVPVSDAGIWIRPNPCGNGSGKDGAITDSDILDFRFAFLESDILTASEQLSFYARTELPIAAIITSGGENSCHAWVRIDAKTKEEYDAKVKALYLVLEDYGIDKANKNPSRLSRLAGAKRKVGAFGDGIQKLLYINGECRGDRLTDEWIRAMASRLEKPPPLADPMKPAAFDAMDRYQSLIENKGKNGLMTGFSGLDADSGGLKKKQMYVIAAESKCGKSTWCMNVASNAAIHDKNPVAIFSMEMCSDELVDLFVAMNGPVDRNVFNTGNFQGMELDLTMASLNKIGSAPIYIFDNPSQTLESIRENVLHLKAEVNLSLVIVDYLQLISPTPGITEPREQEIARFGRGLRILASDADVPVIAVSQLNDDGKLRESRAVGHTAHAVMVLEEIDPTDNDVDRKLRFKIQRARSMPRGEYPIVFQTLYARMYQGKHETRVEDKKQENLKGKKPFWER